MVTVCLQNSLLMKSSIYFLQFGCEIGNFEDMGGLSDFGAALMQESHVHRCAYLWVCHICALNPLESRGNRIGSVLAYLEEPLWVINQIHAGFGANCQHNKRLRANSCCVKYNKKGWGENLVLAFAFPPALPQGVTQVVPSFRSAGWFCGLCSKGS